MTRLGLVLAALILPLTACSEEPDPWAAYTEAERGWLESQAVDPTDERLAEATIAWGKGVCAVFEAGGDAGDIWDEFQDHAYRGSRKDVEFRTRITDAKWHLCREHV